MNQWLQVLVDHLHERCPHQGRCIVIFSIEKLSVVVHSFGGRVFFKMNARESLPFTVERAVLIDSSMRYFFPTFTYSHRLYLRCKVPG